MASQPESNTGMPAASTLPAHSQHDPPTLRQRRQPTAAEKDGAPGSDPLQPVETDAEKKSPAEQKVMGRTPDGTIFTVPHTPDMLTSIFHPRQPKTPLDFLTIASLSFQILAYFLLSRTVAKVFFVVYFAFWRSAYNAGLGWVLKQQSERGWIVKMVKRHGWMDEKKRPKVRAWVKQQLVVKMDKDYNFEALPLDYNIWLMFRSIVDVILLNDFVAYSLFAFSCTRLPEGHSVLLHVLRWMVGWGLIFFNLWVKMDAHRVVKDYAWYWGDCFFLCLQNLVFDGVYEIAPDPMYSLGYAGYYGLSLVSGSYAVLFVSLAAHAAQFLFLHFFENPHIERTYGEKKPLAARVPLRTAPYNAASVLAAKGNSNGAVDVPLSPALASPSSPTFGLEPMSPTDTPSHTDGSTAMSDEESDDDHATLAAKIDRLRSRGNSSASFQRADIGGDSRATSLHDLHHKLFRKDTVVFKNIDPFRGSDFLLLVGALYSFVPLILPKLGPKSTLALLYANALAWRAFHSFGLGTALRRQSENKWIVRHFLKHYNYSRSNDAVVEAFANWKIIYNTSLVMTYLSYGALCFKCYAPIGRDWTVGTDLLRHVLGLLLVALHVWTANSSYDVLGPFGWLYGDFFIDEYPHQLYYTGIYRFLNNPERSMGGAAFFGLVLISGSKLALTMAFISHVAHWWFLSSVEGPHMRKLYGEAAVRKDSGVTKQLKTVAERNAHLFKAARPAVKEMQGTLEKVQKDATVVFEDFLSKNRPKFEGMLEDTKLLLQQSRDRLLIVRIGDDVATIDRSKYSLSAQPSPVTKALRFHLGEPISVKWAAAEGHSRRDWIGMYLITRFGGPEGAEESRLITKISSQGKWLGVAEDEWEGDVHTGATGSGLGSDASATVRDGERTSGVSTFRKNKLPWVTGTYELRYHHDAKHNVLARSGPLEIYVDKPSDATSFEQIYASLGQIVTFCLDSDISLAPRSQTGRPKAGPSDPAPKGRDSDEDPDDFTIWDQTQAKHIAYGIKQAFDVDFDSEVIVAEANVRKLASDVLEARKVLDPQFRPAFSMEQ